MTIPNDHDDRNELDASLARALRAADEPPLLTQVAQSMAGRALAINILGAVFSFVFFGLSIVAAVRFFGAGETRGQILWATAFLFCSLAVAMLKMWFWMLLNRNAITREIKRLEVQVARLADRG